MISDSQIYREKLANSLTCIVILGILLRRAPTFRLSPEPSSSLIRRGGRSRRIPRMGYGKWKEFPVAQLYFLTEPVEKGVANFIEKGS